MKELIPLSNYVLEQLDKVNNGKTSNVSFRRNLEYYTHFLHQNLNDRYEINGISAHPLNRFIPCDLEGNVLQFPEYEKYGEKEQDKYNIDMKVYLEAKDRVLFQSFYVNQPNKENDDWIPSICYANILHVFWDYSFNEETEWKLSKGLSTIQDLCKYNLPLTVTALKNYKP